MRVAAIIVWVSWRALCSPLSIVFARVDLPSEKLSDLVYMATNYRRLLWLAFSTAWKLEGDGRTQDQRTTISGRKKMKSPRNKFSSHRHFKLGEMETLKGLSWWSGFSGIDF